MLSGNCQEDSNRGFYSQEHYAQPGKYYYWTSRVSGLDPKVTEEMYRLIEKINCEDKITIIMISHDMKAAMNYASHILHIGEEVFYERNRNMKEGVSFD